MVTEIEACPHIVFRKLPNIKFFTFYFIASNQEAKMYYIVYISIMIKHLGVIFCILGWKIVIGYQNMNFIHEQFDQYFTPKNSDRCFKFTSTFLIIFLHLAQQFHYDFQKIKGFTCICVLFSLR